MVLYHSVVGSYKGLLSTPEPTSVPSSGVPGPNSGNDWIQLVTLVFILIAILFAAYYTSRLVGKFTLGQLKNSNFKVIDTYRISPNKYLQIVKIANKYIAISVSKDNVQFLSELDESEIFIRDDNMKENLNFKQIFENIRNKAE